MIKSYKDLGVWKKGMSFVTVIYKLTACFPSEERFGLITQLRRAAVSVPSNIAEGHSRRGRKDYIQYISIAIGSVAEIETQLLIAESLEYVKTNELELILSQLYELQRMLYALRTSLSTPNA